ncbi:MAG: hypothetical protein ABSE70_01720 [Candidatus Limnocylindrales bacterium]
MTKRSVISLVAIASMVFLGACSGSGASPSGGPATASIQSATTQTNATSTAAGTSQTNPDGTTTDSDGFVRFPGEPSRPDKDHYYVVGDICGQFTKPFMDGLAGKTFKKIEPSAVSSVLGCSYYTATKADDGTDAYILLVLDYLSVANQKAGQQTLGRTVTTNSSIPMDNFVATQEDGVINAIYFVLGTDKFLRLDRTSTSALSDADMLALAVKLGTKMKDFK